ncbi:hypothetical protein NP493_944g01040 [Ridgeia piscesae]|uniref:Uncharacterized protein n=1 Tax=Ridgeia piscesae TaxID=27915 RepID=A0AAD9KK36_RIDPI|nr:hypothetical protein NP493_944g01040 [Ridgeia piscesae]
MNQVKSYWPILPKIAFYVLHILLHLCFLCECKPYIIIYYTELVNQKQKFLLWFLSSHSINNSCSNYYICSSCIFSSICGSLAIDVAILYLLCCLVYNTFHESKSHIIKTNEQSINIYYCIILIINENTIIKTRHPLNGRANVDATSLEASTSVNT